MMKRLLSLFLAAAMLLLLLTACGGGADSRDNMSSENMGSGDWNSNSSMEFDEGLFDATAPSAPEETGSPEGETSVGRKVIYTANIQTETTDFDSASQALGLIVEEMSGYFESRSISNFDTYRSGHYTIRVPAEQFESFCSQIGQVCHVTDLQTGEENVSDAYYDIEARLTTQRTKLERLQKLLSEADNMADIITIESAISDTELQIEYLTGSLRHYDALIDYATIYLNLREVYRLSNVQEPAQNFGGRMAEALQAGLEGAITLVEELVLFLAHIWVLLIVLVPVGILIFRRVRRQKRREAGLEESSDQPSKKE